MKKIICLLLVLLMAFSVCGIHASAIATPLEAGSSMASAALIPNFGVDYVSSLDKTTDVDWFKFTTLPNDAYYAVSLRNNNCGNYLRYYLYDANLKELAGYHGYYGAANNEFLSCNLLLETNTVYYIQVYHSNKGTGNYEFSVNFKYDETPNTINQAVSFSLNNTVVKSLDGFGDEDWFKFSTTSVLAEYKITVRNYNCGNYLRYYLYDTNLKELAGYYGYYGASNNDSLSATVELEANTVYYLKIYHSNNGIGNYEFSVTTDAIIPAKALKSISLVSLPNKTTYSLGQSFDKSGMVVRATYTDNSTEDLTNYTVSGFNPNKTGTQTLTVSVTLGDVTKTATFNVVVTQGDPTQTKTLQSISVTKKPSKTRYKLGEAFDPNGMEVRASFSDGTQEILDGSQFTVTGYDASVAGTQTITVTAVINGVSQSDSFTVTVRKKFDWNKVLQVISMLWKPLTMLMDLLVKLISAL